MCDPDYKFDTCDILTFSLSLIYTNQNFVI